MWPARAYCSLHHSPATHIASPQRAPVLDASQATRGSPDSAERHRQEASARMQEWTTGSPDPQTTMVLMDRAAWSRPRQIPEAACKGRPPDPGLPIRGLCFDPTAYRRRGSEVRERPDEAGFAAVRRSLAQRARNGPLKRSPRFEGERSLDKISR